MKRIEQAIVEAPTLRSLNFDKEFILYTFAYNTSYASILIQNNDEWDEVLIFCMILNLQGAKLKYTEVEKKGVVVFKYVKHFRSYFLKAHTNIIVTHMGVRSLFVQKKWGKDKKIG